MRVYTSPDRNRITLGTFRSQLIVISIISLVLIPIVLLIPSNPLRLLLSLPVYLFFPGYCFLLAMFPRKENLYGVERLLLGLALSMALLTLVLMAINFIWSLELYPCLASVTACILITAAIAWRRQGNLNPVDRYELSLPAVPGASALIGLLRNYRFYLWTMLVVLTGLLLGSSLESTLEPFAIESLHIFTNLPLFSALFIPWAIIFFYLALSRSSESEGLVEKVFLAAILALIFNGFWILNAPYGFGSDHMANLADVNLIQQLGKLPDMQLLNYPDNSGAHILAACFSRVSGLPNFEMATLYRFETSILSSALTACFLFRSLKSTGKAMLALILITVLAAALSPASLPSRALAFRADIFSGVYWFAFLLILFRQDTGFMFSAGEKTVTILLVAATTVTYIGHSYLIIFVVAFIYLMQKWDRETVALDLNLLFFPVIVVITWSIYVATHMFNNAARLLPELIPHILSGEFLEMFTRSAAGGTSTANPLWLTAMSYLRMAFFGAGTLLAVTGFFIGKRLGFLWRREIATVFAIGAFTVALMLLEARGIQFTRYLIYVPVFLAPVLIRSVASLPMVWRRLFAGGAVAILLITVMPSFLVYYGSSFSTYTITEDDIAAGEYMADTFGGTNNLTVYSNRHYPDVNFYYLPNAEKEGPVEPFLISDEKELWEEMNLMVTDFNSSFRPVLFVISERASLLWYHELGILPDTLQWREIEDELGGEDDENMVFSNEYIKVYANSAAILSSEAR